MAKKVVVVGSSNTDMILQVEHLPQPGETILGGQFAMAAGGKGANQAVAAARAGGEVAFVARVGEDLFGKQAVEGLERDGIDVRYVVQDSEAPSGVALIFVAATSGENSIGVAPGANGRLLPSDVEQSAEVIRAADVLVLQLESPLETVAAALKIASASRVRTILNPAPAQPLRPEILKQVTILTPNESEAELLTGIPVADAEGASRAACALRKLGPEIVIVTLGAAGVFVDSEEFTGAIAGISVDAVDTTAAGDVFNGALAVAVAEDLPLEKAVRFATAAAALSVTKLGAQPSAPTRQAIEALMHKA